MTRSYFRRADGVMLLYDVTSDRSFLSVRQWIEAVDVSLILIPKKSPMRNKKTWGHAGLQVPPV